MFTGIRDRACYMVCDLYVAPREVGSVDQPSAPLSLLSRTTSITEDKPVYYRRHDIGDSLARQLAREASRHR
jgi:hypothetical protein